MLLVMIKNIRTFFSMLRQLYAILSPKQRMQSIALAFALLLCATLETLGVSVVIPFILALFSPEQLMGNKYVSRLMELFRISTYYEVIVATALLIIICYVLKNVVMLTAYYFQGKFHNYVERDLSILMLKAYLEKPYTYYLKTGSADMIRGVHEDIIHVVQAIDGFSGFFAEIFTCIMIGILLIYMDPFMAIGLVGVALLIALLSILVLKKKISECGAVCRESFSKKYQFAMEPIMGYKEVAIYQRRKYFIDQYTSVTEKACRYNTTYLFIQKLPNRIVETVFIACLLLLACVRIGNGGDTARFAAVMGTMAVAAVRILPSISNLANYTNTLVYNRSYLEAAYHNIMEIREEKGKANESVQREELIQPGELMQERPAAFEHAIRIQNVGWKYEDGQKNILKDVSFEICKGESVGLIGESGAGKSTLVNIILGLLKPQSGSVQMDNIDISAIPMQWAGIVGYVPQSVFLLDDTVRNNIAFGIPQQDIDDQKIWNVLKDARLDEFIRTLPNGLETIVGEQGVRFSGGQRQRIAIARALYHDPEILILDEATSALDNETEAEVMHAIDGLHGRKTMIVIAHRLTTIQNCDKVYEVKNGNVYLQKTKK